MIFENAYITNAGHELLTRATAGNTIIWGKCGCYSEDLNDASQSDINEKTTLSGAVAIGSTSAVFESEQGGSGRAKISCQVDNTDTANVSQGFAKTFGLWAKIDGDQEEKLVVIAITKTYQPTYFPTYTGPTTKLLGILKMSITVQSGAASTISIDSSVYALADDLQTEINAREALEGRAVTTHSAGDMSTGDDQTILGEKWFNNELHCNNGISTGVIKSNQARNYITINSDENGAELQYWVKKGNQTYEKDVAISYNSASGESETEFNTAMKFGGQAVFQKGVKGLELAKVEDDPYYPGTGQLNVPVGGVVIIYISSRIIGHTAGETITATSSEPLYTARINADGVTKDGNYKIKEGEYIKLSGVAPNKDGAVLAMRIA